MSEPIQPSEAELNAAEKIVSTTMRICSAVISGEVAESFCDMDAAAIIATHTRHEGRTAKDWRNYCVQWEGAAKDWQHRAESAESELAAVKLERDKLQEVVSALEAAISEGMVSEHHSHEYRQEIYYRRIVTALAALAEVKS